MTSTQGSSPSEILLSSRDRAVVPIPQVDEEERAFVHLAHPPLFYYLLMQAKGWLGSKAPSWPGTLGFLQP